MKSVSFYTAVVVFYRIVPQLLLKIDTVAPSFPPPLTAHARNGKGFSAHISYMVMFQCLSLHPSPLSMLSI